MMLKNLFYLIPLSIAFSAPASHASIDPKAQGDSKPQPPKAAKKEALAQSQARHAPQLENGRAPGYKKLKAKAHVRDEPLVGKPTAHQYLDSPAGQDSPAERDQY